MVTLSGEQARALLAQVEGDRLAAAYLVALSTGLRQGELLGLGWADIDFTARTLRVSHALQRIRGEFVLVEPKTARSRRTLPMRAAVAGWAT
jgi:integrase